MVVPEEPIDLNPIQFNLDLSENEYDKKGDKTFASFQ